MEEDPKKISFSFKQVSSKPKITPVVSKSVLEKTVQFIDCVEEKSIKIVGLDVKNNDHELIIPMPLSAKRQLPSERTKSKQNDFKNNLQENGAQTLDELAIQAILLDCQKTGEDKEEDTNVIEVPMIVNPPEGKEMSTAEDYENVPVSKFGLAMLRGMGWEPTKGVGKNSQLVATNNILEIRPKGMGLGADKLIKSVQKKENFEEELKLKDGSYVQFVLGRLDGQYGQVQGFDEGAGRVVIKIARTNQMEKVSENTFRLVTKSDYDKNSKVINIKEYKEYHKNTTKIDDNVEQKYCLEKKSKQEIESRSRHHKTKKSKHSKSPHKKHKSDHNRHKKYKRKRSSS